MGPWEQSNDALKECTSACMKRSVGTTLCRGGLARVGARSWDPSECLADPVRVLMATARPQTCHPPGCHVGHSKALGVWLKSLDPLVQKPPCHRNRKHVYGLRGPDMYGHISTTVCVTLVLDLSLYHVGQTGGAVTPAVTVNFRCGRKGPCKGGLHADD